MCRRLFLWVQLLVVSGAANFQAFMPSEFELYKKVIQEAGIKAG